MISVQADDYQTWREQARVLLLQRVPPADVLWTEGTQAALFQPLPRAAQPAQSAPPSVQPAPPSVQPAPPPQPPTRPIQAAEEVASSLRVPRSFLELAQVVCHHSDPERFAVLYRALWKLLHRSPRWLDDPLDPDSARLNAMRRAVREEEHRMQAFVRFRKVRTLDGAEHQVAWYDPAHPVLGRVAPFFARRYPALAWTLMTPRQSVHWDTEQLRFGPGQPRSDAPGEDQIDALFLSYYEHVFNPARSNWRVMTRHLSEPIRKQLPEGHAAQQLLRQAPARVAAMQARHESQAAALLPPHPDWDALRSNASGCRACAIGEHATQTVFGEGPRTARIMFVGEQPGDEEDLAGKPFVGPAGRLLSELLKKAGLTRSEIYLTNAVKHFKFERTPSKHRLHMRPTRSEVDTCRAWLMAEVDLIKPEIILCLGATAAQSFCGPQFRVQRDRGKPTSTPWAPFFLATYHPSALLRAPDAAARRQMEADLSSDLDLVRARLDALLARAAEGARALG